MYVKGIWVSENPYGYRQSLGYPKVNAIEKIESRDGESEMNLA